VLLATALGLAWIYGSLARWLLDDGRSPVATVLVTILATGVGSVHFLVRPHLFTLGFVLLTLRICQTQHERGGWAIVAMAPLMVVWANLHGRFLAGPLIVLTAALGHAFTGPLDNERRRNLGKFYHRPPGGESWADVALRLRSALRDVLAAPGGSALIVAHDAVVMLVLYLLLPMEEAQLLEFAASHTVLNASLTHVVRNGSGWELAEFSAVGHLEREGAPVTVHPGSPDVEPA